MLDLLGLPPDALNDFVTKIGQKPYRARQLRSWIFEKYERDFARMTNLSADFRQALAREARVGAGEVENVSRAADGETAKYLFRFDDGARVEAVSMREEGRPFEFPQGGPEQGRMGRHAVCLSTQAGCAMGCVFCATGALGFTRNLTVGEMLLQAVEISRRDGRMTNVVFMGMGEPLLNLENLIEAIEALADPGRFALGTRKITVSTCGIVPGIEALSRAPVTVRLALSLNSPFQEQREQLMPIARRHPLERVLEACDGYAARTGKRVTVEYVLLRGVNTGRAHAKELARIAQRLDGKINLIEYNAVSGASFDSPSSRETLKFREWLEEDGASVTIRFRRGREIAAGCGQLAARSAGAPPKVEQPDRNDSESAAKVTDERKRD
jgi:23S rRNA (adenine2503-C2)-methyltransferase